MFPFGVTSPDHGDSSARAVGARDAPGVTSLKQIASI